MDDLRSRLEKAAELTKGLPESVQAEAFRLAFGELSGGTAEQALEAKSPKPSRRLRRRPSGPPGLETSTRPRRRAGPKAAVEGLIDAGFFASPRSLDEIRSELDHSSGQRFPAKAIATTVLRLLRERRLSRERGADGNYRYRAG